MYRYFHLVIVLLFGSVHDSFTDPLPAVAVKPVGLAGVGWVGAASEDSSDATPLPVPLTARILNL